MIGLVAAQEGRFDMKMENGSFSPQVGSTRVEELKSIQLEYMRLYKDCPDPPPFAEFAKKCREEAKRTAKPPQMRFD